MAQILFTRRNSFGSSLIRAVSWSEWSHVQVLDGRQLIGASFPKGVVEESLSYRLEISSRALLVTIPTQDDAKVISYVKSQIGKPYDTFGAIGLGLHRDWQDPSSWWCSELVTASIKAGGAQLF